MTTRRVDLDLPTLYKLRDAGASYVEMAAHFGCSTNTIKRRLIDGGKTKPRKIQEPRPATVAVPLPTVETTPCAVADPDIFFPDPSEPDTHAKALCGRCRVKNRCLEWALEAREPYGVWGGMNESERRTLLRNTEAVAA